MPRSPSTHSPVSSSHRSRLGRGGIDWSVHAYPAGARYALRLGKTVFVLQRPRAGPELVFRTLAQTAFCQIPLTWETREHVSCFSLFTMLRAFERSSKASDITTGDTVSRQHHSRSECARACDPFGEARSCLRYRPLAYLSASVSSERRGLSRSRGACVWHRTLFAQRAKSSFGGG